MNNMKIIKLGDFSFRFICPDYRTEFEIESKELKKDESSCYYIECPLCNRMLIMHNENEIVKYCKKRKELENDN